MFSFPNFGDHVAAVAAIYCNIACFYAQNDILDEICKATSLANICDKSLQYFEIATFWPIYQFV